MQIVIRGVSKSDADKLSELAAKRGISRHQLLHNLVEEAIGDPSEMVVAYTKVAQLGDVNADEDVCPFCDENKIELLPHLAHYANGQIELVCGVCAEAAQQ